MCPDASGHIFYLEQLRLLGVFFLFFHYPFKFGTLAEIGQFGTYRFPTHYLYHLGYLDLLRAHLCALPVFYLNYRLGMRGNRCQIIAIAFFYQHELITQRGGFNLETFYVELLFYRYRDKWP